MLKPLDLKHIKLVYYSQIKVMVNRNLVRRKSLATFIKKALRRQKNGARWLPDTFIPFCNVLAGKAYMGSFY